MKTRIFSLSVAILLVASMMMTACGGGQPAPAPSAGSQAGSAAPASSEAAKEAADPFGKYTPSIPMTFARTVDNDLNDNILPKTPGETVDKNRWLDLYSNDLGIDIKYAWTVRGGLNDDAYTQKLNVTIASGDLPDVCQQPDT